MGERAAIWLRVSSDRQDEANQGPDTERYCETHGYAVVERYTVHAKSAFHGKHQADLDRVLADMRAGKYAVLVVWHSDRIERRQGKALLDLLAEFHAAGGRVESVQEPTLGQLDLGGQVTTFIAGLMNHEKSKHISDQVGIAHDRIRANDALLGRAPWGYVATGEKYGKRLEIVPELAGTVQGAFERVADGESLRSVCEWLDTECPRGKDKDGKQLHWWPRSLWVIIRNPAYCGRRQNAAGVTVHRCPAIVDAGLWQRANDALVAKPGRRGPASGQTALLTSVIYCQPCAGKGIESPMYRVLCGSHRDKSQRIAYYRCSGKGADRKSCGNMVRLDLADEEVTEILSAMASPRMVPRLIKGDSHYAELTEIQLELAELPKRGLSDEDEDSERARLRSERKRLESLPSVADRIELVETGESVGQHFSALDDAGKRAMILADGIKVYAVREDDERRLSLEVAFPEFVSYRG
jgi:DNA invertase Pin-like site-specific DNA recombinase